MAAGALFLAASFFLTRSNVRQARSLPRPVPRAASIEQIASWMTIPYIARIYHIPEQDLFQVIEHDPRITPKDSIEALARKDNHDPSVLIQRIKDRIKEQQPPK